MSNNINKILYYIMHPKKLIIYLMNKNYFWFLSDKLYLKIKYRLIMNKKLNLKNPKTFNEKLQWLKLYDRKDIYTTMVDKYDAKKYVANIIGEEYIIPTLGIYNSFDEIDFDELPEKFVMKPTHTSGNVYICKNKEAINYKKLKKEVEKWLNNNYYKLGREWPYKNVKPRIIIEKYMEDKKNKTLADYKIMCFQGVPKMSFTCTERFEEGLKVTFFDINWNKMPFERKYPCSNKRILKPKNYNNMLKLSKILSKNTCFLRVDWYEINDKLYFGELTFFPGNGTEKFNPEIWDYKIGELINIDGDRNE